MSTQQHEFVIPGGKEKGKALDEASAATLTYWIERISSSLADGESRNATRDRSLVAAMKAALERKSSAQPRASGARTQQQSRSASSSSSSEQREARPPLQRERSSGLARSQADALSGSFTTAQEVLRVMRQANELAHVITPQTSCGILPAGCAIASSVVFVDVERETYGIPYKTSDDRGLDKTALAKIAGASGADWDPQLSCRVDDGSDPHYCAYRAVCRIRNFDGSMRTETGTVEMDLREGSEVFRETEARAAKDNKPNTELALMRKFILRHAESKAMNRAIRRLGVRTKYTRRELEKPFVVMRLSFTGHSDDPATRELFAGRIADSFLATARPALYGPQHAALPAGSAPPIDAHGESAMDPDPDGGSWDADGVVDDGAHTDEDTNGDAGDDYPSWDDEEQGSFPT